MAVQIQLRRDTAASWTSVNPVLALGEPGVETDTLKVKVGDGATAWNSLAYSISNDYGDLLNTPTTLSGYGITDAVANSSISTFGASLVDDADASTARTTLGLGTAATTASTDYATSAQGALADTAVQPGNNIETSIIDSADSSAITITPDVVMSAGLTVGNHIIPSSNENIDLGSDTNRFRELFLSGNTISLDGIKLSSTGTALRVHDGNNTKRNIESHNIDANDVTVNNITASGYLRGPASFVIDPAAFGDDTGTVVIAGNLQVDGVQTTINSTTVEIDDLNFTIASEAANSAAANGAGITVGGAGATLNYTHATTSWDMNKPLNVTGDVTVNGAGVGDNGLFVGPAGYAGSFVYKSSGDAEIAPRSGKHLIFADSTGGTELVRIKSAGGLDVTGDIGVTGTVDGVDIAARDAILTSTTTTAGAALPKAGGTMTGNVTFGDSDKAIFGAGNDLEIYHNGSHSFITDNGDGDLYIRGSDNIRLQVRNSGDTAWTNAIKADDGAATSLMFDGDTKLATTASGISVTGAISSNKGSAGTLATFTDGVNSNFVVETSSLLTTIGNGGGSASLAFKANNTEAMRINASGLVGIGTAPAGGVQLDVRGTGVLQLVNTDTVQLLASNGGSTLKNVSNNPLLFGTNNTERMRIDSDGRVGIGTTTPSSYGELAVYKASSNVEAAVVTGGANYATYRLQNNAQRYSMQIRTDQSNAFVVRDETASANRFVVATSGNVGIGTASPTLDSSLAGLSVNASGTVLQVNDGDGATLKLTDPATGANRGLGITLQGTEAAISNCESGSLRFGTGNAEAMRIDSLGNLGIGMTNPNSYGRLAVMTPTTGYGYFGIGNSVSGGGGVNIGTYFVTARVSYMDTAVENGTAGSEQSRLTFGTALAGTLSEKMRIDSSGNVGIGVTNTSVFNGVGGNSKLVVKGSDSSTNILNNSNASITIANDDGTASNTSALHFARADTDDNPHFAGASIVAQFVETQVTGQYPKGQLSFLTSTASNTAPSEKMRIASSGNVGIGTASSEVKLEVNGGADGSVVFGGRSDGGNGNNRRFNLIAFADGGGSNYGGGLTIQTRDDVNVFHDRITVKSDGRIKINQPPSSGTGAFDAAELVRINGNAWSDSTNNQLGLSVASTTRSNSAPIYFNEEKDSNAKAIYQDAYYMVIRGHNNEGIKFKGNGNPANTTYQFNGTNNSSSCFNASNSANWNTTSDSRIKENIQALPNGSLAKINALRPVTFDYSDEWADKMAWWKFDENGNKVDFNPERKNNEIGWIAQEYETIFPEDVTTSEETVGETTYEDFRTLKPDSVVPNLVKAVQELSAQVEALQAEINTLKGE